MKNLKISATIVFLFCFTIQIFGTPPLSPNPESKYTGTITDDLGSSSEKLISLAEAIPADKYGWRPAEGVRSVSEVLIHAASANYFLLSYLGGELPEGLSRNSEKTITDKADVVTFLKESYNYAQEFIPSVDSSTLDEEVELPFGTFTKRRVLLIILTHGHEHLGQSIAYARSNGVTPPWSQQSDEE